MAERDPHGAYVEVRRRPLAAGGDTVILHNAGPEMFMSHEALHRLMDLGALTVGEIESENPVYHLIFENGTWVYVQQYWDYEKNGAWLVWPD